MFCNKCGNPLSDGTKFCPKCGNPINNQPVNEQPVANNTQPTPQVNPQPVYQQPVQPQPVQQMAYQQPAYNQPMYPNQATPYNMPPTNASKKKHTGLIISIAIIIILAITALIIFLVIKPFGGSSPMDVADKYMKSMCKANSSGMLDCILPEIADNFYGNPNYIAEEFGEILDAGGKIDYTLYDYEKVDSSDFKMMSNWLIDEYDLNKNKIKEIGIIKGKYFIYYNSSDDEYENVELTMMKYGNKWYVVNYDEPYYYDTDF